MRFFDHLKQAPLCFNSETDRFDFDSGPLIKGATVFLVSEVANQLIQKCVENSDRSVTTLLTAKGKELAKYRINQEGVAELDLRQYVGIIPPFENCFFEWPTPFEPNAVDCGVSLRALSKEEVDAGFPGDGYSFVMEATVFHRFVRSGRSVTARETVGMVASDSEGQLLNVSVKALLPPGVNRSLPRNFPHCTPMIVVLVALMMLNCRLVKSTLSTAAMPTRQQRRYAQQHPSSASQPLVQYYTLSIDAERTKQTGAAGKGGWEQAWHTVRGFLRHLKSGEVVPVRPHSRGNPLIGVIHKNYAIRT